MSGANGFLGRNLVEHLVSGGWSVLAVDKLPCEGTAAESVVLDILTPAGLTPFLDKETTLFHLAASADIRSSVQDSRNDFDNNVRGLFEVLEAARQCGSRVLFASTASVFNAGNPLPWGETGSVRPMSPYAAGKLAGEAYCYAYHRSYGVDVRIARMFNVYGIGMTRFVIHDLIRKIQADSTRLEILGDGNQIRDFLYVEDAVRGLETIATRGEAGEDYNLASGVPVCLLDLARTVATLMGCPEITLTPTGRSFIGDTPRWYADISKIYRLGFEPHVSLEEGVRRTIEWLRRNRDSVAGR
ncbi:MAG: NAD-dependent epimerase/dehydratase family protein [Chloroflexota bacterium]